MLTATKGDLASSGMLLDVIPRLMRSMRGYVREVDRSGLTIQQFRVLAYVALQPCNNKQLADWQGVSLPAVSRMVNFLARRKVLIRTPDTNDRRQVKISLSKKGEEQLKHLRQAVQAKVAARVIGLAERDKKALADGLSVLKTLFNET